MADTLNQCKCCGGMGCDVCNYGSGFDARRSSSSVSEGGMPEAGDAMEPQWWFDLHAAAEALEDSGAIANAKDVRRIAAQLLAATKAAAPADALSEFAGMLAASQKPLDSDIATILHKNIDKLYSDERAPADAPTVAVPVEAYLWLMGLGRDGFVEDRDGMFWWRGAFNDRAGLDMMAIYQASKGRVSLVPAIPGTGREKEAWQPFETAPRDGTHVIATNGTITTVAWYVYEPPRLSEKRDMQGRYVDEDYYEGFDGWLDLEGGLPDLTHWMPIPAAPSHPSEAKAGEDA